MLDSPDRLVLHGQSCHVTGILKSPLMTEMALGSEKTLDYLKIPGLKILTLLYEYVIKELFD